MPRGEPMSGACSGQQFILMFASERGLCFPDTSSITCVIVCDTSHDKFAGVCAITILDCD